MLKLPLIIAHRGASHQAPENTLAAFNLAWEQGADGIEGDFHLTQDGEIVCVHDEILTHAQGNFVVAQHTRAELQAAFPFIPTLPQVLATVPVDKSMVIEIKCGPEAIPRLLQDLHASAVKSHQVMVIAFDARVIGQLKQQAPHLTACWLTDIERDAKGELSPSSEVALQQLQRIFANGISTYAHPQLNAEWLKPILAAGYQFHVWTVDEVKLARQMMQLGVLSLTTNEPLQLRAALSGSAIR